jgi:hypothetical protein
MFRETFTGEKNWRWLSIIPDKEKRIRKKPITSEGHLWYLRRVFILWISDFGFRISE